MSCNYANIMSESRIVKAVHTDAVAHLLGVCPDDKIEFGLFFFILARSNARRRKVVIVLDFYLKKKYPTNASFSCCIIVDF